MKFKHFFFALLAIPTFGAAQTPLPITDQSLINLQTPTLLGSSQSGALIDLRYFGGYDKTLHGSLWYGYGVCKDLEIDLAGSFSKWNTADSANGDEIRFGGTDEELSLRYRLPSSIPVTVQAGLAYEQTPAQPHRLASTLGGSIGYSPDPKIRFYLNPKAVFLDDNSLVGISVGGAVDIVPKITLIGDWTPLVAGNNTIDTQTGTRSRGQLYSAGLRFSNLYLKGALDIGVTNASGITTGSSLTPSLGASPALFVRLSYRF